MQSCWRNFIDGHYVNNGAGRIDVIDPGTSEKLAEHALADTADNNRAVQSIRQVPLSGAAGGLDLYQRLVRDRGHPPFGSYG